MLVPRIASPLSAFLVVALAAPSVAWSQPVRHPPVPHPVAPAVIPNPPPPPSEAELRFQRGSELFNVRNFDGALAEFQRSYELSGEPGLLYNLGRTYQALGRYPEAARVTEDYLRRATDLTADRRAEVEGMLEQTRAFIARIDVRVAPAGTAATISLDGEEIADPQREGGLAVGPGRHALEARAEGWQTASATVLLASGDRREVRLELRHAPEARAVERPPTARLVVASPPQGARALVDGHQVALPSAEVTPGRHAVEIQCAGYVPWRGEVDLSAGATRVVTPRLVSSRGLAPTWFIAGAAATGALLVASAVFGGLTESAHGEYAQRFRDEYAQPDVASLRDRGETMRLLTNVSLGLAAAAGVATAVLFIQTRFRRASSAEISFGPTPGGASGRLQITF